MDRLFLTIFLLCLLYFGLAEFPKLQPKPNLAWMSTTWNKASTADRALRFTCEDLNMEFTSMTALQDSPLWGINFQISTYVDKVVVRPARLDKGQLFREAYVFMLNDKTDLSAGKLNFSKTCAYFQGPPAKADDNVVFQCNGVGKYLAIALNRKRTHLELCHITLYGLIGISRNAIEIPLRLASASQSSTNLDADRAIDGKKGTQSKTKSTELSTWWQIDLGDITLVSFVTVVNADSSPKNMAYNVLLSNDNIRWEECSTSAEFYIFHTYETLCGKYGKIVRIEVVKHKSPHKVVLALAEVKIYRYFEIPLDATHTYISSMLKNYGPMNAVTKNCVDTDKSFVTSTTKEYFPSWAIDLKEFYYVDNIIVTGRQHTDYYHKFSNVFALALNKKPKLHSKIKVSDSCFHFRGPTVNPLQKVYFRCKRIGRFIALVIGETTSLEMCHIQMFGYLTLIPVRGKNAWQSSTKSTHYIAGEAVDKNCIYANDRMIKYRSSTKKEKTPMWAMDLQKFYYVDTIVVTVGRGSEAKKFKNAVALVMSLKPNLEHGIKFKMERTCGEFKGPATGTDTDHYGEQVVFSCSQELGRFVVIALVSANEPLQLCHVSLYENPPL